MDRTTFHIVTGFVLPSNAAILGTRLGHHLGSGGRIRTFLRSYGGTSFAVSSVAAGPMGGSPTPPFAASALRRRTTHGLKCSISRAVVVTRHLCRSKLVACVHASSIGLDSLTLNATGRTVFRACNRGCCGFHRCRAGDGKTRRTRRTVHPACVDGIRTKDSSRRGGLCRLVHGHAVTYRVTSTRLRHAAVSINVDKRARHFITINRIVDFRNFLRICVRDGSSSARGRRRGNLLPPMGLRRALSLGSVITARHFARHPPHCARTDLIHHLRRLNVKHPSACTPAVRAVRGHRCIIGKSGRNIRHTCAIISLSGKGVRRTRGARAIKTSHGGLVPASVNAMMGSFLVRCFPSILSCGFATDMRGRFSSITRNRLM